MDNYLAPVRTRSLPDLLATQPANGICPGNRGWGRQGLPAHVPWHRTAIRRICTVHRRVLCTAPYTRDLAGAGVIGACSHAGPGRREVSAAAVGTAASASRPRSKGRNVPGSAQCGVASALCAVLLLLLLVFILENYSQRADTSDFGAHGHLPPGVALLLAGVPGMLLAVTEAPGRRDAAAERGAEIAGSDPKRGAAQSRWCRRQNPPSQAACGSQGRAAKPSGHARQRSCRRQRRLQRSAIHDAEGSACGVLRKDFPSP